MLILEAKKMKTIGIIAEYNPFHPGHLYHLKQAKKMIIHDGVIAVMSGHFTQRGELAIIDKWARAEMALRQGIDLVLELPVLYSCRSAYWFARGGIETLHKTGIVTHVAFGVETDDLALLRTTAKILANEPLSYQEALKAALKEGLSFPDAKAKALMKNLPSSSKALGSPNNILALSYLQVLEELNLSITPVTIKRKGADYHDSHLSSTVFPSATAIRKQLFMPSKASLESLNSLKDFLPPKVHEILTREIKCGKGPVNLQSLSPIIMALLRRSTLDELENIIDMTEGLENRIKKTAQETTNIHDFLEKLKTKRYTYTRLQRFLVHLLLSYTKQKEKILPYGPPYLRVLGFTEQGKYLLKEMKQKSSLPIIIKGAHSNKYISNSPSFKTFWEMDVLATDIFSLALPKENLRSGGLDYYKGPVQLTSY